MASVVAVYVRWLGGLLKREEVPELDDLVLPELLNALGFSKTIQMMTRPGLA